MRFVFFSYWIVYLTFEYIKTLNVSVPLWLGENFKILDYGNMFYLPLGYMMVNYVMGPDAEKRFSYYCIGSFFARIMLFMMGINVNDGSSAYRNPSAYSVYGFAVLFVCCAEAPFVMRKIKKLKLKATFTKK